MSEQHQTPPQPPADPATAMVDAYVAGDKEGAQRLLDARNARDGVGQGGGENNAPVAFPESAPTEQGDFLAEQMRSQPDGERWIAELGGAGTPDFGQNVSLAVAGYERLLRDAPHIIEAFTGIITREDGTEFSPGDDPSVIYHLAKYERLLRAGGGDTLPAPFQTMRNVTMNGNQSEQRQHPSNATSIQERIDSIYEAHPPGSRGYASPKVQKELQSLFRALGDGPIPGRELSNG